MSQTNDLVDFQFAVEPANCATTGCHDWCQQSCRFEILTNLSRCWQKLDVANGGKITEAKLEAIEISRRLSGRHPANVRQRLNFIESINNAGIAIPEFDVPHATELVNDASKFLDRELINYPRDADPQNWATFANLNRCSSIAFISTTRNLLSL